MISNFFQSIDMVLVSIPSFGGLMCYIIEVGQGHQRFTLPPGCNAQFKDHIIFSDLSIRLPSDSIHFDWSWDTTDMFKEPSATVSEELKKLQNFGVNRPTLESLNLRMAVNRENQHKKTRCTRFWFLDCLHKSRR